MNIEQEIVTWDGKSSSEIGAIYRRHCDDEMFAIRLIESSRNTGLQKGATWLLKRYLESSRKLAANEILTLFRLLPELEHWESKLHILQCIPYLAIDKSVKKYVEAFLQACLVDNNKFVRAWAYNGFYEISVQYPEYREKTKQLFEMAMRDEAPSVKARIRNIVKNDF